MSKYEMIWADPGNYDEDGDELPYGAVGYAWASHEEFTEPYVRKGAYVKTVGVDGMPEGEVLVRRFPWAVYAIESEGGRFWFNKTGACGEVRPEDQYVDLETVDAVMFGGES